jgi:hypothetical protein
VPGWVYMVGGQRWWNQGVKSLRLFSHLCVQVLSLWRRGCCMWGQTLQSYAFSFDSVSRYCSEFMAFWCVVCHVGSRRPLQAFCQNVHLSIKWYWALHIPVHKQPYSVVNVDQKHVFCSQELSVTARCPTVRHTCVTLHHVYKHNSEPSSSRSLKCSHTGWKSLANECSSGFTPTFVSLK